MTNQQPYYHEIQILFTTTGYADPAKAHERLEQVIKETFADEVVDGSIEVMENDPDPGNPADLM